MELELEPREATLLTRLVEQELDEINPEIRHSATSRVKSELRRDRELLRGLLARLQSISEQEKRQASAG